MAPEMTSSHWMRTAGRALNTRAKKVVVTTNEIAHSIACTTALGGAAIGLKYSAATESQVLRTSDESRKMLAPSTIVKEKKRSLMRFRKLRA